MSAAVIVLSILGLGYAVIVWAQRHGTTTVEEYRRAQDTSMIWRMARDAESVSPSLAAELRFIATRD